MPCTKAATALLFSFPTATPFLYPCCDVSFARTARPCVATATRLSGRTRQPRSGIATPHHHAVILRRHESTLAAAATTDADPIDLPPQQLHDAEDVDHLNPSPADYSSAPFTDACTLTVAAGSGGHGCISFLREKYIANGPPNGGDGGTGGNVYIQAVQGETSLHKIARRGILKAGRGKNGQGSLKGGARGNDILITVPVGTVVREIARRDPLEEEERQHTLATRSARNARQDSGGEDAAPESTPFQYRRDKWLLYPGTLPKYFSSADFPALPRPRRSNLAALQPPAPLRLDLDKAMESPILLAAGAMGGLGNPHFVTKSVLKPKYATKGDDGMRISLQLELKLLADVGLVGLPNAGKSTLLRALTRSRTRVGNWAFTTLSPNIGTLVLDDYSGRPRLDTKGHRKEPRNNITIADIPGLIEGAHQDRGLGLGFLRHIERAAVLAFVVDLNAGDAVESLKGLWREVGEYEKLRERELNADTERAQPQEVGVKPYEPFGSSISPGFDPEPIPEQEEEQIVLDATSGRELPPLALPPISSKPWLVIATKADLSNTQDNYSVLREYLKRVEAGEEEHPSGKRNGWRKTVHSVPVSAINKQGVTILPEIILRLLDD